MNSDNYDIFASFYDELMSQVNYKQIFTYLTKLFEHYTDGDIKCLLDVGCGTGTVDLFFNKKGIDVIGTDDSEQMLSVAQSKASPKNKGELFLLKQSMDQIDLLHLVDGAFSTLDSVNHITDPKKFKQMLQRVYWFLRPGAVFIFDVNTRYKHQQILGNNTFVYDYDDIYCVWKNTLKSGCIVDMDLDFFVKNESESYEKYEEHFSERAYSHKFIVKCAAEIGFEFLTVLEAGKFTPPTKESQRIIYVLKKGNKNG